MFMFVRSRIFFSSEMSRLVFYGHRRCSKKKKKMSPSREFSRYVISSDGRRMIDTRDESEKKGLENNSNSNTDQPTHNPPSLRNRIPIWNIWCRRRIRCIFLRQSFSNCVAINVFEYWHRLARTLYRRPRSR